MAVSDSYPSTPLNTKPADCPIFVVDDDPAILRILGRALEAWGYPVTLFAHPQDVIDALPHEGLRLLITDRQMPDIDGIDLARMALEVDPDLAVIMLTGTATADSAMDALRAGVGEYLQKPISPEMLESAVQQAMVARDRNIVIRKDAT